MDDREAVLGFKPQKESIYNKLLPYKDAIDDESNAVLSEIKGNLARAVQLRDLKVGAAHWVGQLTSVYGRSIRTNNDVEGYHNRLNRRAKKGNLSFYLLVTLLYHESRDIPLQCKLVKEKKLRRQQRKSVKQTQGRLMQLWEDYGAHRLTTSELLSRCGKIYGPS